MKHDFGTFGNLFRLVAAAVIVVLVHFVIDSSEYSNENHKMTTHAHTQKRNTHWLQQNEAIDVSYCIFALIRFALPRFISFSDDDNFYYDCYCMPNICSQNERPK